VGEDLRQGFVNKCRGLDRPVAALLKDLKQRGLLEDTLVVWSGEFGRTPMRENRRGSASPFAGRDHNPGAYTMWLAGAGVKRGYSHGETDPSGYRAMVDKVSAHDLHATLLHLLGIDHQRFTFHSQGADQRLTNITKTARVVSEILA
jgi:arylsulfatase A-like enzyme